MSDSPVIIFPNEKLLKLSAEACRILVFIICTVKEKELKIKLKAINIRISNSKFFQGVGELIDSNVISKVVSETDYYWVNVAILVVGNIHN